MMQSPTEYQRLGRRTLIVFLLNSLWILVLTLLVLGALTALLFAVPQQYSFAVTATLGFGGLLGLIAILGSAGSAWMRYTHYSVALGEASFKFKQGILNEEELGIPYRRVKEVNIQRSPSERMLGVSTLVITVAEEEEDPRQSTVRINALEKDLAETLQQDILKRAEVEKMDISPERSAPAAATPS